MCSPTFPNAIPLFSYNLKISSFIYNYTNNKEQVSFNQTPVSLRFSLHNTESGSRSYGNVEDKVSGVYKTTGGSVVIS